MNYGKHKNEMERPERPVKPRSPGSGGTSKQYSAYSKELEVWEEQMERFQKARDAYRAEDNRLYELFKADVLKDNGLTDHPKAELVWKKAQEQANGDSNGIEWWVEELAELVD